MTYLFFCDESYDTPTIKRITGAPLPEPRSYIVKNTVTGYVFPLSCPRANDSAACTARYWRISRTIPRDSWALLW